MPATIVRGVAYEDRQLDFVAESLEGRGLGTDVRFEEFDVERVRILLDLKLHGTDSSGADDLLDHREVIEVGAVRPDLSLAEVGHADAGQLDVSSGCFHRDVVVQDEWAGVIGFDQPFGVHPVADLVDGSQPDHDVGERDVTQRGELSECCQP